MGTCPNKASCTEKTLRSWIPSVFFLKYLETSHFYLLLVFRKNSHRHTHTFIFPNFYFKMFTPLVIASVLYHVLAAQMKIPCMCSLTWLILDWPDSCPDSSRVLKSFRKCQESSWRNDLMVLGTFTCHHMIIKTVGYVELASRARSVLPADLYSDYYIISINIL